MVSRNTVEWAATQRYPYIMLATELEATKQSFAYYHEVAEREGYQSGTQNIGYLFKVHVDETEEMAFEIGRKFIEGPPNPFLEGNTGVVNPYIQRLPGLTSRTNLLPTGGAQPAGRRLKAQRVHSLRGVAIRVEAMKIRSVLRPLLLARRRR